MASEESIGEKLEQATDHQERAEQLRKEALEEAEEAVVSIVGEDEGVKAKYDEKSDSVVVIVRDRGMREKLDEVIGEDTFARMTNTRIRFSAGGDGVESERERTRNIQGIVSDLEAMYEDGAPIQEVIAEAEMRGMDPSKAEHELQKLKNTGDIYEPTADHLRTV